MKAFGQNSHAKLSSTIFLFFTFGALEGSNICFFLLFLFGAPSLGSFLIFLTVSFFGDFFLTAFWIFYKNKKLRVKNLD
jgi:hypothetical protein